MPETWEFYSFSSLLCHKTIMGLFRAEVCINSVTGLGVAFMGSPEQSSRPLTRLLKQGVKIAFMGPPEQSSQSLARSLKLFITQV